MTEAPDSIVVSLAGLDHNVELLAKSMAAIAAKLQTLRA